MMLEEMVCRVLERLDDAEGTVWSREEISIYVRDGYDQLCRNSKCLYDWHYVENLPAIGNYSSDEEYELALQIPNLILTGKRNFTSEVDKALAVPGSIGPASITAHMFLPLLADLGVQLPNPIGQLPRDFVEIERVTHDQVELNAEFSRGLARDWDNRYESQVGDTDWFTVDKDGLFTLRRYPAGDGLANYAPVIGWWGVEVRDSDYTGEVRGDWGALA